MADLFRAVVDQVLGAGYQIRPVWQENFTGCRVLTYCVMSNHFHLLLEVPPVPEGGIPDEMLLRRLKGLYSEAFVAAVDAQLVGARKDGDEALAAEIHARFTCRMHDLSEFMKTLLQRFTRWFNGTHERSGTFGNSASRA